MQVSRQLSVLHFKREDCNPTGSHKDRAAALQMARVREHGQPAVVISSSGNAAIASSRAGEQAGVPVLAFVHPHTDPAKLAAIDGNTTTLVITERAINSAKYAARKFQIPNVRPSIDPAAVEAGELLAGELDAQLAGSVIDDIVAFATSGATVLGIAQYVQAHGASSVLGHAAVHAVQGEGNAWFKDARPLGAAQGLPNGVPDAHHAAAGRLGVRRSRRARPVQSAVAATAGFGWVVSAGDVADARSWLADGEAIMASDESCANVAVARQRARDGRSVVCLLSGAPNLRSGKQRLRTLRADDEFDAVAQLERLMPQLVART